MFIKDDRLVGVIDVRDGKYFAFEITFKFFTQGAAWQLKDGSQNLQNRIFYAIIVTLLL